MRALPLRFVFIVLLAVMAAAGAAPLAAGHAHAASLAPGHFHMSLTDDGVGPALTHNDSNSQCDHIYNDWQADSGPSGFPNLIPSIVHSNGTTVLIGRLGTITASLSAEM